GFFPILLMSQAFRKSVELIQPSLEDLQRQHMNCLSSQLRAIRHAAIRAVSGATIHRLSNCLSNITMALSLIETALSSGQTETVPRLLTLAEESLTEARVLICQVNSSRYWPR